MSTTKISDHANDNQNDNLRDAESAAHAENKLPDNVVKFEPPVDRGPTKPLRLTVKERIHLVAEALGIKTSPLLLAALTLMLGTVAQAQSAPSPTPSKDDKLQAKAKELHKKILAFDSHVDLPLDFGGPGLEATTDGKSQFDLVKTGKGGLKGAALAVFVAQGPRNAETLAAAKADAEKKHQIITSIAKTYPDRAAIAYTPDDARRIARDGKFAIVESFLNAWPLGGDLSLLDEWHRKGVRIFGFVHAGHNDWTDSSRPSKPLGDKPEEHGGLSPLGKQAVARLNELGVLIDVSQLSTKAFFDTLKLTKAPVAATHSGVRGLVDVTRNLNDEELVALKANGGVIQIVAFSAYLRPIPPDVVEKLKALADEYGLSGDAPQALSPERRAEYTKRYYALLAPVPKATLGQLVDSIDYAVRKIGVDHVGIASDFNHGGGVTGWKDESEAYNLTAELLRRGYSEAAIAKLWGGNFLRVWGKAQEVGKQLNRKQLSSK
ncbi:MAG: dipeptidase [Verrucomicrobiales bacterium]|nr:dipeptidase [Verrucomicrobiales bacterium]